MLARARFELVEIGAAVREQALVPLGLRDLRAELRDALADGRVGERLGVVEKAPGRGESGVGAAGLVQRGARGLEPERELRRLEALDLREKVAGRAEGARAVRVLQQPRGERQAGLLGEALRSEARVRMAASSWSVSLEKTRPVGLCGELTMIARVRGVIAASIAPRSMSNRPQSIETPTGKPPARRMNEA